VAWDAPGAGGSSDPPEEIGIAGYADCLAGFIRALELDSPHVVGLSFGGALAIELQRRHRTAATLTLVSAYAGWRGSLGEDAAEQRLAQALALSELAPQDLVDTLLPTMFSEPTPRAVVRAFGRSLLGVRPVGFRAMARASAEDLRDALPSIDVPTLLIYGGDDVRAPQPVAEAMHEAIAGSELVVLPGAGHVCNLEQPDRFNSLVRSFLAEHPG
jgi:pimeloyl-ACP methyl ester carboxylesterase